MLLLGFTGVGIATYMYKQKTISAINIAFIYFPKIQITKKEEKQNQKR